MYGLTTLSPRPPSSYFNSHFKMSASMLNDSSMMPNDDAADSEIIQFLYKLGCHFTSISVFKETLRDSDISQLATAVLDMTIKDNTHFSNIEYFSRGLVFAVMIKTHQLAHDAKKSWKDLMYGEGSEWEKMNMYHGITKKCKKTMRKYISLLERDPASQLRIPKEHLKDVYENSCRKIEMMELQGNLLWNELTSYFSSSEAAASQQEAYKHLRARRHLLRSLDQWKSTNSLELVDADSSDNEFEEERPLIPTKDPVNVPVKDDIKNVDMPATTTKEIQKQAILPDEGIETTGQTIPTDIVTATIGETIVTHGSAATAGQASEIDGNTASKEESHPIVPTSINAAGPITRQHSRKRKLKVPHASLEEPNPTGVKRPLTSNLANPLMQIQSGELPMEPYDVGFEELPSKMLALKVANTSTSHPDQVTAKATIGEPETEAITTDASTNLQPLLTAKSVRSSPLESLHKRRERRATLRARKAVGLSGKPEDVRPMAKLEREHQASNGTPLEQADEISLSKSPKSPLEANLEIVPVVKDQDLGTQADESVTQKEPYDYSGIPTEEEFAADIANLNDNFIGYVIDDLRSTELRSHDNSQNPLSNISLDEAGRIVNELSQVDWDLRNLSGNRPIDEEQQETEPNFGGPEESNDIVSAAGGYEFAEVDNTAPEVENNAPADIAPADIAPAEIGSNAELTSYYDLPKFDKSIKTAIKFRKAIWMYMCSRNIPSQPFDDCHKTLQLMDINQQVTKRDLFFIMIMSDNMYIEMIQETASYDCVISINICQGMNPHETLKEREAAERL